MFVVSLSTFTDDSDNATLQERLIADVIKELPADQARMILHEAIADHLGNDWQAHKPEWQVIADEGHRIHLNRGDTHLEFRVDTQQAVVVDKVQGGLWSEIAMLVAWISIIAVQGAALLTIRMAGYL